MFYLETKDGEKFFTKDSDDDQAVFKNGEKEREEVLETIETYECYFSEIWEVLYEDENSSDLEKLNTIGDIVSYII